MSCIGRRLLLLPPAEQSLDSAILKVEETENTGIFQTPLDKLTAGKLALKEAQLDRLAIWEQYEAIVEDRGWPRKSFLYFDRALRLALRPR